MAFFGLPRDALTKMKDVYLKNPQMGDPNSVDPRLSEISQNIERLKLEVQKFDVSHFFTYDFCFGCWEESFTSLFAS